jgi:hypothetical protein
VADWSCVNAATFGSGIDHLIGAVGTRIDYKLQRTSGYDPATGVVTKIETEYKNLPAIIMTHEVKTQGATLDSESHEGMFVISGGLDFFPSPGDLAEIPAASVRGSNPYKTVRITENTPMYVGATPIQYTLLWRIA